MRSGFDALRTHVGICFGMCDSYLSSLLRCFRFRFSVCFHRPFGQETSDGQFGGQERRRINDLFWILMWAELDTAVANSRSTVRTVKHWEPQWQVDLWLCLAKRWRFVVAPKEDSIAGGRKKRQKYRFVAVASNTRTSARAFVASSHHVCATHTPVTPCVCYTYTSHSMCVLHVP